MQVQRITFFFVNIPLCNASSNVNSSLRTLSTRRSTQFSQQTWSCSSISIHRYIYTNIEWVCLCVSTSARAPLQLFVKYSSILIASVHHMFMFDHPLSMWCRRLLDFILFLLLYLLFVCCCSQLYGSSPLWAILLVTRPVFTKRFFIAWLISIRLDLIGTRRWTVSSGS